MKNMKKIFTPLLFVLSVCFAFGQTEKTDAALTTQANTIKNETTAGANTATRIGTMHLDIIASKVNNSNLTWANILSKPTTLAGFGILDAPTTTYVNNADATLVPKTRTITINAETYDLATNPTFTVAGGGGGTWGSITGTLSSQTDLNTAINAKVTDALVDGVTTVAPSQNAVVDAMSTTNKVLITGATTLDATAFGKFHYVSGTTADYTITLPTAVGNEGKMILFKLSSDLAVLNKVITIDGAGTEKIDQMLARQMAAGGFLTVMARSTSGVGSYDIVGFDQGEWIAYVPTYTGFSVAPDNNMKFKLGLGTLQLMCSAATSGTSNATTFTMTLPPGILSKFNQRYMTSEGIDGGAAVTAPGAIHASTSSNIITLYKTYAAGAWSASLAKNASFHITLFVIN